LRWPFEVSAAASLAAEPFQIEATFERARAVVAPIGELDLAATGPFREFLFELEAREPDLVVFDLRRLSFMDCSGLRTLLEADARARQADRRVTVVCAGGQIRRLLFLSKTDRQLDIVELG
jgi:anti-anti-sigma factor